MINLCKSQLEIMKQITQDSKTDESQRILQNMIFELGKNKCTDICLNSLSITSLLNDDVLQYLLSFCETVFLFDVMYLLNKKFKQLVMQTENNLCKHKYSNMKSANTQQRTFIISTIRKKRCDIENHNHFLGPFNDINDVIKKSSKE